MYSTGGDTTQLVPGYPIRTPWDHSSVDSSPRPIAASHVLHRLLVPRHPPYALTNLTTQQHRCRQPNNHTHAHTNTCVSMRAYQYLRDHNKLKDARIHCAILNQHQTLRRLSAQTSQPPLAVSEPAQDPR